MYIVYQSDIVMLVHTVHMCDVDYNNCIQLLQILCLTFKDSITVDILFTLTFEWGIFNDG